MIREEARSFSSEGKGIQSRDDQSRKAPGAESKGDPVKKSPYGIRFRTGLYISEEDLPEILRHGIEHHLYNGFR